MGYAFDRLGFLQFEQLCAALLELEGAISADAWVGEADRLRSVLSGSPVAPPLVGRKLAAPVLVQCVWVRSLLYADLVERVRALGIEHPEDFAVARSFVVITNLDAPPSVVERVAEAVGWPSRRVEVLGAGEIGARMDGNPELRLAMPSLLGLRDLYGLVDSAVDARSTLDRAAAVELTSVFVPTGAYRQALDVLRAHRFAVLTGPPEMGKTTIARMVALAKLTAGWEAHECTRPENLWARFDPARAQVFVADDAFGSTEYRPDAAERWARDMERILRALDDRHWLVWTSRPAPLRAGLGRIHRERGAERFPAPSEVLVDASRLSAHEKTLILFRHAKGASLPHSAKAAIRRHGAEIVGHPHFTPERIRRFVAALSASEPHAESLGELIRDQLTNATEAMATSFAALGPEHRDLLVAMLDAPPGPVSERDLTAALRRHHDGALPKPPLELVDRLTDHFVRVLT